MTIPAYIVLLPPLLVIALNSVIKRLDIAFFLSIIVAGLIATHGYILQALSLTTRHAIGQITSIDNLYTYTFLFIAGIFIVMLDKTGGARAFAHVFTKHIRSAKGAETSSLLVSLALFIDDYLSSLTVGYVMRPITDKFHVPRAKLAYLVHGVSTPLIMIMPISSWLAFIAASINEAGIMPIIEHPAPGTKINADPFFAFLQSIPFIFYSFFALASVILVVRSRISFGPLHRLETIASATGNLFGDQTQSAIEHTPTQDESNKSLTKTPSLIDFIIPIGVLLGTFVITILYLGNYHLFGGTENFINAFKNSDQSSFAICIAGIASLASSLILALPRKKIEFRSIASICSEGVAMMLPSVIMLILAKILGSIIKVDLKTGEYLASLIGGSIAMTMVPCMFFIISFIVALLLGTSWGAILLLLPMATPIITSFASVTLPTTPEFVPLLYPVLGAVFSGSICGDHLSPISQTTLMAATSSGINPITHAKTQYLYALPAIAATMVCFLVSGYLASKSVSTSINCTLCLATGILLCMSLLLGINIIFRKLRKKHESPTK